MGTSLWIIGLMNCPQLGRRVTLFDRDRDGDEIVCPGCGARVLAKEALRRGA